MSPVRVVLATMPPLLGAIIRETLARDGDLEIVSEVATLAEIASAVERAGADIAVLGVAPDEWVELSDPLRNLLAQHPRLTIIGIARNGRTGYVYRLQPRGVVINDISPTSLAAAIRSVTAAGGVHPSLRPFSAD